MQEELSFRQPEESGANSDIMQEQTTDSTAPYVAQIPTMHVFLEEAWVNEDGILSVRGWSVSLSPLDEITVYLAGKPIGTAHKNLRRDDVGLAHPQFPNSSESGFLFRKELEEEELQEAVVHVIVRAVGGIERRVYSPIGFAPTISKRSKTSVVQFHCDDVSLTSDGSLSFEGWAISPSGISKIEVAIGNQSLLAETGRERPDVGNQFPEIYGSHKSGFRCVGNLAGTYDGEQIIVVTIYGLGGEERIIFQPVLARNAIQNASVSANNTSDSGEIHFCIDEPSVESGEVINPVRGFLTITGWAVAKADIARIRVFIDGFYYADAYRGIRREDLVTTFPEYKALLAGFTLIVPPQALRPGKHEVKIFFDDNHGDSVSTSFVVHAESAAEGPVTTKLRTKLSQAEIDLNHSILSHREARLEWTVLFRVQKLGTKAVKDIRSTLMSLKKQAYEDWRAIIPIAAGDASETLKQDIIRDLESVASKVEFWPITEQVSLAQLVRHGMLVVVSPGDKLGEDALLELNVEAAVEGLPDFLYADERRVDPADGVMKAFFKPDWSPDLLLSTNYVGRIWAASAELLESSSITLNELQVQGEYNCVLRLTENASHICHVKKVLCERAAQRMDSTLIERRALLSALARRGISAQVTPGCIPGTWRTKRELSHRPLVSLIIPSIGSRGLVKVAIDSIRSNTSWPNYEIIIVDNITPNGNPEQMAWKTWMRENADKVVELDCKFNWSLLNNVGATASCGEFLVFLNDDIEIVDGGWLDGLVEQCQRPEVGVVGPQLLYPDGRVQHAGVFLAGRSGRHAFRFFPADEPGPFGLALTQRNVVSVTGACMMVRRELFQKMEGFDETHPVVNNDLDFSLRVQRNGLLVVYTPYVSLIHHEMVSRAEMTDEFNSEAFDSSWKTLFLQGDPYFHPNLARDSDDYTPEAEPTRQFQVGHPLIAANAVRRILAVKVDHIGDFICAFPAFRQIKQHFPECELTVVCAKASLSLAALEPSIDRVIEFNFYHARSEKGRRTVSRKELSELKQTLDPFEFDIAIDLRRQPDSREILQYSGARWLAGFDQNQSIKWLDVAVEFEGDVARSHKRSHVSDSLVQLVDALAISCRSDRRGIMRVPEKAEAKASARNLVAIQSLGIDPFEGIAVCVHLGAGAENKQWPPGYFADLIDLLIGRDKVKVVLVGGKDELPIAIEVLEQSRHKDSIYSLVGKTGLRDLSAVLLACDLYVGNDSGPKHMAAALGVPTIGIHSGSVDAGEWGPMGSQTLTLRREMVCGPCYIASASDCPRNMACLRGLSVGDVYRSCRRMLALTKSP